MPRRIELPDSGALFDDPLPVPGGAGSGGKAEPQPRRPASPRAASRPATSVAASRPAKPRGARSAAARRVAAVEARLGELPIDLLVDLRDGLERLMLADHVDARALEDVLAAADR